MLSNDKQIIAIVGPTCTGKSALSLEVAGEFGGEIINADSMQVYRHFDIGTAKPDASALGRCRHHLIDIVEPHEEFNAAMFRERADSAIQDVRGRGKVPVLVGGTGLYLRALVYGLFRAPTDNALREELKKAYERDPLSFYEELKRIDHAYAMRISFRDKVRAVRAMEVFRLTGTPVVGTGTEGGLRGGAVRVLKIAPHRDRRELYERINRRVDEMFASGWVEEVRTLLSTGYDEDAKPFSGIGYREILLYIKGMLPYGDMVEIMKKQTRHYAKRQFTWFSKEKDVDGSDTRGEREDQRQDRGVLGQMELKRIIEAVLFSSSRPVTLKTALKKAGATSPPMRWPAALRELISEYIRRRGPSPSSEVSGGYQMRTKADYREWVTRFVREKDVGLTRSLLETLSIIAYKQPISKREIDRLRGVDSARAITHLLDRRLIELGGRLEDGRQADGVQDDRAIPGALRPKEYRRFADI